MSRSYTYMLILLVALLVKNVTYAQTRTFKIDNDSVAKNIESNITRYPNQIRVNLLNKLAQYYLKNSPQKTIAFASKAIDQIEQFNNKKYNSLLLHTYIVLGEAYNKSQAYFLAGEAFLKATELSGEVNNDGLRLRSYLLLSNALFKQGNYYQSIKYLKQTNELASKTNNLKLKNQVLSDIAYAYLNLNRPDSAQYFLDQVLLESTDTTEIIRKQVISAEIKRTENKFHEARILLNKGLKLSIMCGETNYRYDILIEFARIYALEKKYKLAQEYLDRSYLFKPLSEDVKSLISSAHIYEENSKFEQANQYYKLFYDLADSIFREKDIIANLNFRNQVQLLKNDREITSLKVLNLQKERDIKKTRLLIIISSTLFLMLIIASYFIVNYQREKHKNLQLIIQQKEELTQKKHKEDIRKVELRAAIAQLQGQEIERERLAKELHDGVGGTLAGIKMELESVFTHIKKEKKIVYLLKSLQDTYQEVRSISKNLSLPNFSSESLNDNLQNLIQFFPGKHELDISFNAFPVPGWDDLDLKTQKEIYRMIQEGITNVIKHAKATELEIQIVNDRSSLTLIMEDNGVGFDTAQNAGGIGIKNMRSRSDLLNGDLSIESAPNEGTTISLTIPLKM